MADRGWTFLTNHAHVLLALTRSPDARVKDVAEQVGISERMVHLVLKDLDEAGYLARRRIGRRTAYDVIGGPLRHPMEQEHQVGELLAVLSDEGHSSRDG